LAVSIARKVNRNAAGIGATVSLAIAIPSLVAYRVYASVHGVGCNSNSVWWFEVLLIAAWAIGGYLAAERELATPLVHAALAAFLCYLVVGTISAVVVAGAGRARTCGHEAPVWSTLIFNALLASSSGVLGGLIAARRRG
jgi:hypothetical protein